MTKEHLFKILQTIAEGSLTYGTYDSYIVVENPDFEEGSSKDPNYVIDIYEVYKLLFGKDYDE